jgi:hypothetical protein
MDLFLGTMVAVAFIAGVSGLIMLIGRDDRATSFYPWPGPAIWRRFLTVAAVAAALALVAGAFSALT